MIPETLRVVLFFVGMFFVGYGVGLLFIAWSEWAANKLADSDVENRRNKK